MGGNIEGNSVEPLLKIQNAKNVTIGSYILNKGAAAGLSVDNSTLTFNGMLIDSYNEDAEALIIENNATLHLNRYISISGGAVEKDIKITGTGNKIVSEPDANWYNETIYMEENAGVDIFYKNKGYKFSFKGDTIGVKQWFKLTLLDGMEQEEAFSEEANKESITGFEGYAYGTLNKTITVTDNICAYIQTGDTAETKIVDNQFTITDDIANPITLLTHEVVFLKTLIKIKQQTKIRRAKHQRQVMPLGKASGSYCLVWELLLLVSEKLLQEETKTIKTLL